MATRVAEAYFLLRANADRLNADLAYARANATTSAQRMALALSTWTKQSTVALQAMMVGLNGVMEAAGMSQLSLRGMFMEFARTESSVIRFNLAARNMGGQIGWSQGQLQKLNDEIAATSGYTSNQLRKAMEEVMAVGSNVRGDMFGDAIRAAALFAKATGTDVVTAAHKMALALQHPENAMRALKAMHISLTAQEEMFLKQSAKMGPAGMQMAQRLLMGKMLTRGGGANEAMAGSVEDMMQRMGQKVQEMSVVIGGALKEAFTAAYPAVVALSNAVLENKDLFISIGQVIGSFMRTVAEWAAVVITWFGELNQQTNGWAGYLLGIVAVGAAVAAVIGLLVPIIGAIVTGIGAVLSILFTVASAVVGFLITPFGIALVLAGAIWYAIAKWLGVWEVLKESFADFQFLLVFKGLFTDLGKTWAYVWKTMKAVAFAILEAILFRMFEIFGSEFLRAATLAMQKLRDDAKAEAAAAQVDLQKAVDDAAKARQQRRGGPPPAPGSVHADLPAMPLQGRPVKFEFVGVADFYKQIQKAVTGGTMEQISSKTAQNTGATADAMKGVNEKLDDIRNKMGEAAPAVAG